MGIKKAIDSRVRGRNHHWWALLVVCLGTYMTTYDLGAVSMSLPQIMTSFKASLTLTSWVLLAQLVTAAALLLPAGKFADLVGRKKVFNLGFVVVIVASLLCGLSQNLLQLIIFRVLQATGAAMIQTTGFAIVAAAFPERDRGKGLGISSATAAIGATSGPAIGGIILNQVGWQWIFLINVPVGIVAAVAAHLVLKENEVSTPPGLGGRGFDVIGACLAAGAIASLVAGLSIGQERGWSAFETRLLLGAAIAAVIAFPLFESRQIHPLVDPSLLKNRPFVFNSLSRGVLFLAMASNVLLMPFYLQVVMGYSPLETGMLIAPTSLMAAFGAPFSGWLVSRISTRYLSAAGMAVVGVGLFLTAQLGPSASYKDVLWRLIVIGLGYGFFQAPNNTSIMDSVSRDKFGITSGLMSLSREIGRSTGTALASAIVVTSMSLTVGPVSLYSLRSQGTLATKSAAMFAFQDAIERAFLVASFMCILGVIFCLSRGKTARDEGELGK